MDANLLAQLVQLRDEYVQARLPQTDDYNAIEQARRDDATDLVARQIADLLVRADLSVPVTV